MCVRADGQRGGLLWAVCSGHRVFAPHCRGGGRGGGALRRVPPQSSPSPTACASTIRGRVRIGRWPWMVDEKREGEGGGERWWWGPSHRGLHPANAFACVLRCPSPLNHTDKQRLHGGIAAAAAAAAVKVMPLCRGAIAGHQRSPGQACTLHDGGGARSPIARRIRTAWSRRHSWRGSTSNIPAWTFPQDSLRTPLSPLPAASLTNSGLTLSACLFPSFPPLPILPLRCPRRPSSFLDRQ